MVYPFLSEFKFNLTWIIEKFFWEKRLMNWKIVYKTLKLTEPILLLVIKLILSMIEEFYLNTNGSCLISYSFIKFSYFKVVEISSMPSKRLDFNVKSISKE